MIWFVITHIISTALEWIRIGRLADQEKDLEIFILRHQLDILERKHKKPIRPTRVEKLALARNVQKSRSRVHQLMKVRI